VGADIIDIQEPMAAKGKGKGKGGGLVLEVQQQQTAGPGATSDFILSMRVCNSISATAEVTSTSDGEVLAIGPVRSTKMMGPPPMMDLEARISNAFPKISRWIVTSSDLGSAQLQLSGPEVQMIFAPDSSPPKEPISHVALP